MKGIELPINILVIIAMAVMVLLGLVAIYMGGFGGGAGQIQLNSAKTDACQQLIRSGGCGDYGATANILVSGFDADKDGSLDPGNGISSSKAGGGGGINPPSSGDQDNLFTLCVNWFSCPQPYDPNKPTDTEKRAFVDCCHKKVCGCPI